MKIRAMTALRMKLRVIIFSETGNEEKDGIYLFEISKKPLSFLPPLVPLVLKKDLITGISLAASEVSFSYDYKQAIFDFTLDDQSKISYLLAFDEQNQQAFDISTSRDTLLAAWEEERFKETQKILETTSKKIRPVATGSFDIISISPDETKMLYRARENAILPPVIDPPLIAANQVPESRGLVKDEVYVYDKKEDKNYHIDLANFQIPGLKTEQRTRRGTVTTINFAVLPTSIMWYPDSRHLVIREEKQIVVIDYDATNRQTVYSGPYDAKFLGVADDGKLLILANLNPQANKLPDLYSVGIK